MVSLDPLVIVKRKCAAQLVMHVELAIKSSDNVDGKVVLIIIRLIRLIYIFHTHFPDFTHLEEAKSAEHDDHQRFTSV